MAVCGKIDRRSHDQSLAGPGDRGAGPRPLAGALRAGHSPPPYGAAPLIPALCLAVALAATGPPAATAGAPADTTRLGRLATYVDRLEAFGFSGQILVAEHGQVVIDRASGWADRRFAVPMSPETRLGIGSVTKNFVAAAVLRLASRHRLKVTDRLGDRLPGVPADKADIRLDQILEHTAGFHRDIPDGLDQATRDEVVSAVLSSPLAYLPGADFQYSNAGYDLLAAVVERAAGTSFDEFLRRELLTPAGLTASGIAGAPGLPEGPAAIGYDEWKEVAAWRDWPHGWSGTGSGRMVSTARELWRWAEGLRSGRTLGLDGWALMSARHSMDADSAGYGFGLWVSQLSGGRTLKTLGGDVDGYRAECRIYPEDDRVIVVLTNQDLFGLGVQRRVIANAISRLAQGLDPPEPPPVAALDAGVSAIEGAWVLPAGGRIEVWRECGRLRLGARGQDAVDLFEPDDAEAIAARHRLLARTDSLMRGATVGDSTFVRRVLPPAEYSFAYPFLNGNLRGLEALNDRIEEVTGLGVAALPWSHDTFRSYVRLRFRDRSEDLFMGFTAGTLNDVTVGEGRPYPVMLPVAPLAEGGFATFDMIRQRAVRLRVERTADGTPRLVVPAAGGEARARRVR